MRSLYYFGNTDWHKWFAWHRVRLQTGEYVWLKYVQRMVEHYYSGDYYHYKKLEQL